MTVPSAVRIAARITAVALRHWAARAGYRGLNLMWVVVGVGGAAVLGSGALTLLLLDNLPVVPASPQSQALAGGISRIVFAAIALGSNLMVIVAGSALGDEDRLLTVLRPLPISTRLLMLSMSLPMVAVVAVTGVVAIAPILVTLQRTTGAQPGVAFIAVGAAALSGGFLGLLTLSLSRIVLGRSTGTKLLVYPGGVAAWACFAGLNLWLLQALGAQSSGRPGPSAFWQVVAAWPLAADLSTHPALGGWLQVGGLTAALGIVASAVYTRSVPVGMEIRPVSVVRIRWDHRGAAPLTRLELHRLVRTPRVRAGWAAAAVLVVAGLGWMAVTNPENRPTVGSFVVVPMMIAVAHVTLISRGLSPRPAPPQLVIGLRPFGWASALVVASAALATSLAVPVLVALTALTRSLQVGAFVLGLEVFVLALSAVLGSILLPGSENKGGEAAGLFLTGIIASVLVFAVGQAVGDLQGVGVWFLATGVCLLTVPGLVETFRWSYATVGRAPRLKWWGGTD